MSHENLRAVPLLDLITRQSMDEDYRHVAAQRAAQRAAHGGDESDVQASTRPSRSVTTIAAVLLFGLLVAVAAVQTSRNSAVETESRDQLIDRITVRRDKVAQLQKHIAEVRASNTAAETAYAELGRTLSTLNATRRTLGARAGWSEVRGDGVRVRLDDAPTSGTGGEVRDSDLAGLVNGLWQAGATAISVNGQRVTPVSALRNSGSVVRINDVSLSPPYTVLAIGDTDTLQARFAQSTSGIRLQSLTRQLGMPYDMQNAQDLTVAAAPASMLTLRHASTDDGAPIEKETP